MVIGLWNLNLKAQLPGSNVTIQVDLAKNVQVIDNFGASGCWFSEGIGNYWPADKKEKIAQLLFSQKIDERGKLEGIGLSAWRFNIGAGTLEQGDSSGIRDFRKRTDSFLNPDGTYNWSKQAGQRFFLQKAHDYGVETLIAFSNSPPIQFTKNGLGYKTQKDFLSNLREDRYNAYAGFLADIIKHFDSLNLHFKYIAPVNEPQWDWSRKYMEADQEGSPWTNQEIYQITNTLNAKLKKEQLTSKILISEAGMLTYLYSGSGKASRQIQHFFDQKSPLYIGKLSHVPKIIAGHSYFTESNDKMLFETRKQVADTVKKHGISYWQSEYSMLGDGFREGTTGPRSAMDCALFVSKVIHTDLTVGHATAWQFWNAYEPGNPNQNTRYYLIALQPKPDFKDGEFTVTKNLWALGHFSRFVRPGMIRVIAETTAGNDLMVSAFKDKNERLVLVITNYGTKDINFQLSLKNVKKKYKSTTSYLTNKEDGVDMKLMAKEDSSKVMKIQGRSIETIVID